MNAVKSERCYAVSRDPGWEGKGRRKLENGSRKIYMSHSLVYETIMLLCYDVMWPMYVLEYKNTSGHTKDCVLPALVVRTTLL